MKPATTIDKQSIKTQTILDENGNKIVVILALLEKLLPIGIGNLIFRINQPTDCLLLIN